MEAIRSIGWKKAILFVWYEIYKKILHFFFIPQCRIFFLRLGGASVGNDTIIMDAQFSNLYHHGLKNFQVGRKCFVGDEALFDLRGRIFLQDEVTISNRVALISHINVGYPDHPLQQYYPTQEKEVHIEKGVYIGTGALVLPGVTVGRQSVVGAGSVVTHDVPPYTVVAGVPAKALRHLRKKRNKSAISQSQLGEV